MRVFVLAALLALLPVLSASALALPFSSVELDLAAAIPTGPSELSDRWSMGPFLGLRAGGNGDGVAQPHLQLGWSRFPLDGGGDGALKVWSLDAGLRLVPPSWRPMGLRPHLSFDAGMVRKSVASTEYLIGASAPDILDGPVGGGSDTDWGVTLSAGAGFTLLSAPGGPITLEGRYRMARLEDISSHFVQVGLSFWLSGTP